MSEFRCGHPSTPDNQAKVGLGRVRCRICRLAWRAAHEARHPAAPKAKAQEEVSAEPPRLGLRRFSWEQGA